jgi:hypothetical protein
MGTNRRHTCALLERPRRRHAPQGEERPGQPDGISDRKFPQPSPGGVWATVQARCWAAEQGRAARFRANGAPANVIESLTWQPLRDWRIRLSPPGSRLSEWSLFRASGKLRRRLRPCKRRTLRNGAA